MAVHVSDMDCQKCSEGVKKLRGCEEETTPYYIEGEKYTRCPVNQITPYSRIVINLYNNVKTYGVLPNKGGLLDQSWKAIEMFNLIDVSMAKKRR